MSDIKQLNQVMQAFIMVTAMTDFIGKDEIEKNLRWAAKNYADRIYRQSYLEN